MKCNRSPLKPFQSRSSIAKTLGFLWQPTLGGKASCHGKRRIIRQLSLCVLKQNFPRYLLGLWSLFLHGFLLLRTVGLHITLSLHLTHCGFTSNELRAQLPDSTIQLLKLFSVPHLNFLGRPLCWFCCLNSPSQVSHKISPSMAKWLVRPEHINNHRMC